MAKRNTKAAAAEKVVASTSMVAEDRKAQAVWAAAKKTARRLLLLRLSELMEEGEKARRAIVRAAESDPLRLALKGDDLNALRILVGQGAFELLVEIVLDGTLRERSRDTELFSDTDLSTEQARAAIPHICRLIAEEDSDYQFSSAVPTRWVRNVTYSCMSTSRTLRDDHTAARRDAAAELVSSIGWNAERLRDLTMRSWAVDFYTDGSTNLRALVNE